MKTSFSDLGIEPKLLDVIDSLGFKTPTPVQEKGIPAAIEGKDIIGIAQTGTGKTLAFGIPMIQLLLAEPGRALVLLPTRELALQVDEILRKIGNPFDIRSVVVVGGMDLDMQAKLLTKEKIRIVIATPGRLMDHLEKKSFDPSPLKMVVLDEADRMLDMGFGPQIERIAKVLPKERRTLLFSATMPEEVVKIADVYVRDAARIEVAPSGAAPEKIDQKLYVVREEDRLKLLVKILDTTRGSVLVFTRTKASAWKLARSLEQMGHKVKELHSDRTQGERRHALNGFKTGLYRILVATDIAARGLDVKDVELVVNFELPDAVEDYVHRIGRTGRAGKDGRAITIATPYDGRKVAAVEKLTNAPLQVARHPNVPSASFLGAPERPGRRDTRPQRETRPPRDGR